MATLLQQKAKAKNLTTRNQIDLIFRIIRQFESDFLDLNKKQLRQDSSDIEGDPIGFYSYATEVITQGRKRAGEPFNAFETGDFFRGFYLDIVGDSFRIFSTDPKTHLILDSENWLSDQIFGLTDKNLKEVITKGLLPFFIKNNREILGL